jgi:hypothetical protein
MRYECPLTGSGKDQRHAQGAYSATIYHKDFNAPIRMTSQSQIEVNLRGSKTLDQKEPGRWLRIDRLHRFDDPVVDMFDTYGLKVVENVLPLILYKTRDK